MNFNEKKGLQPYWDLVQGNVCADVLRVAIELDLFRYLNKLRSIDFITDKLNLDPVNMRYLLDVLWSMSLLSRKLGEPVLYANKRVAQKYFCSDSQSYIGDAFVFRLKTLRYFGQNLTDYLNIEAAHNKLEIVPPSQKDWAKAASLQIAQEQNAITADVVVSFMENNIPELNLGGKLLDLGGGPGIVTIAIMKKFPKMTGALFDFPETAEVAKKNVNAIGFSHRLKIKGGNIAIDYIGSDFDFIWCSSVLHFMPDINSILFKRPSLILIATP